MLSRGFALSGISFRRTRDLVSLTLGSGQHYLWCTVSRGYEPAVNALRTAASVVTNTKAQGRFNERLKIISLAIILLLRPDV